VARAYVAAAALGPGAYNVCSERAVTPRELIDLLRAETDVTLSHEVDAERIRPGELKELRGSSRRLREASGWAPEVPLDATVRDALDEWRRSLGAARPA
jgi:GDP-4-dehydro-6-deoxy-D-mannose reductase